MKKIVYTTSLLSMLLFMNFSEKQDVGCNAKILKDHTKPHLDPYKYDSAEMTRIQYKNKEGFKEIELPLFIGEKYRLVFNTEALPKAISIEVYDKEKESKKRTLLFSNKDQPFDKKQFSFEPSRIRHVYVDYTIPKSDTTAMLNGCVVFMLGFQ